MHCVVQVRAIDKQIQAAKARDDGRGVEATTGPTELRREEGQSTLKIGLNVAVPVIAARGAAVASTSITGLKRPRSRFSTAFGGEENEEEGKVVRASGISSSKGKGKQSAMEMLMEQEKAKKAAKLEEEENAAAAEAENKAAAISNAGGGERRKDHWLRIGLVVKVMNKKVGGGKYYKKKARIRKVIERYVGEVKMLDSGDRLRVDQEDLETVRKGNRPAWRPGHADASLVLWFPRVEGGG